MSDGLERDRGPVDAPTTRPGSRYAGAAGGAPRYAGREDDRSVGSLIRELGEESTRLVREEVALARAEVREKVQTYERNAAKIALGGVLLLGAALVLIVAVNRALTALFAQFMGVGLAVWIAPLVLAAVAGLIGWSMVKSGKEAIAREPIVPEETTRTLKEEKQWITNELK